MAVLHALVICVAALSGESAFLEGDTHLRNGRYGDAYTAFQSCAAQEGPLQPFAQIRMALCRDKSGDTGTAIQELEAFLQQSTPGPWTLKAQTELAELYVKAGEAMKADVLYDPILAVSPRPWWVQDISWEAAANREAVPELATKNYAFYRYVIDHVWYVQPRLDAAKKLIHSSDPEDRAMAILGMLRSNAYSDAGKAILASPQTLLGVGGQGLPLEDLLALSQGKDVAAFEDAARPVEEESAWIRLWLVHSARALTVSKKYEAAHRVAHLVAKRYPETREGGDTLWYLAQEVQNTAGDEATAIHLYTELADLCPDHFRADDAYYRVARLHDIAKRYDTAVETYSAFADRFPNSRYRGQALYRAASILQEAGDLDGAKALYRKGGLGGIADFYAHRGLERYRALEGENNTNFINLEIDGAAPVLQTIADQRAPDPGVTESLLAEPGYERLYFFGRHGMDEGEYEALHLLQQTVALEDPAPQYQAIAEAGFAHTALQFAIDRDWGVDEAGRKSLDRWRLELPRVYWREVSALAKETGIDPYLTLAVAKQESTYRATVVSRSGALGVMQLMPSTAKWLGEVDPNITPEQATHLKVPRNCLRLGAFYLQRMKERSNDNLIYTVASYNGGPGNVDKWRKRFDGYNIDRFIEAIPFHETRDYTKKVLGYYAAYHTLYPPAE